jgi:hypothetical protein
LMDKIILPLVDRPEYYHGDNESQIFGNRKEIDGFEQGRRKQRDADQAILDKALKEQAEEIISFLREAGVEIVENDQMLWKRDYGYFHPYSFDEPKHKAWWAKVASYLGGK